MVRQEFFFPRKGDGKEMSLAEGMKDIAENIVASYETRIRSIESLFETTHQILEGFQNSFFSLQEAVFFLSRIILCYISWFKQLYLK